jgi:hypothetical protein
MRSQRRSFARVPLAAALGLLFAVAVASAASAQDEAVESDATDHVVLTGSLHVLGGESVATAVIFNGPATVEGTVEETLVVFNGRAEISGTVLEDVVVFNGRVVVRSGAEVGGDVVSREPPVIEDGAVVGGDVQRIWGRLDLENLGFAERVVWWIGYSVSTLVLGLLLLLFAPALDGALVSGFRGRVGAVIGWGAGVFFLVPVAAIVLLVTIVAIPLGLFVILALALLYTLGYVVGAHVVGRQLVRSPSSRFVAFLAGWAIVRLVALIPFLGGLVWFGAAILGLGALAVAARRRAPAVPVAGPIPPPPAPA